MPARGGMWRSAGRGGPAAGRGDGVLPRARLADRGPASSRHPRARSEPRGGRGRERSDDRAPRHGSLADTPAGRGKDRGVHHGQQRHSRDAGGAQGVDVGCVVPRDGLPDRCVPGRLGHGGVAVAPAARRPAARRDPGARRDPDGGRSVAPLPHDRHRGLDARLLRAEAADRLRVRRARAVRRVVRVGGRHGRTGRADHDLAGLQRLGWLQPLRRPRRRPQELGGQLRPPLQRRDRCQRLPHRRAAGGRPCRGTRHPPVLLHQRRPPPATRCARRRARLRVPGPRRVLDARRCVAP